jgi:hypothetical protein
MKDLKTGREIYDIVSPLFHAASYQIRQHFLDPGVLLVIAGAHPATKIVVQSPSQEILHEIRTLNLLLGKNKIRFRISTKYLRKEVNNLQRQASLIIESLKGYERLSEYTFPKENRLHAKGFEDIEKWKKERVSRNKSTHRQLLDAIEEGEVSFRQLNLIDEKEKDKIINDFLGITQSATEKINEEKIFHILERVHKKQTKSDHDFEALLSEIRVILKNIHVLSHALHIKDLSVIALETLHEMTKSKTPIIRIKAEDILRENAEEVMKKVQHAEYFPVHEIEKKVHQATLQKIQLLQKTI